MIPLALPTIPLKQLHLLTPSFYIPSVLHHKTFPFFQFFYFHLQMHVLRCPTIPLSFPYLLFFGQQLDDRSVVAHWELLICWLVLWLSPLSGPRGYPKQDWISFSTGTSNLSSTSRPEETWSQTPYTYVFSPAIYEATEEQLHECFIRWIKKFQGLWWTTVSQFMFNIKTVEAVCVNNYSATAM